MKKQFVLNLAVASVLSFASMQTACSSNKEENSNQASPVEAAMADSNGPLSLLKGKLKQNASSDTASVEWDTTTAVSVKRQIEVGDHPGIVLETYKIGQREQKIRFFISDDKRASDLVSNSPQDNLLRRDVEISKSENSKWSLFGLVVQAPTTIGLQKFSDSSLFNGFAVTPQLMICASEGLKNLKIAGDQVPRVFQNWQIDVVNIFVKPVQHADEAESKMAIDSKLKALNFQLSVWTRSGDCFLPSATEMQEALGIADQRIHN